MSGKIVKGIAGFYYVHTPSGVYECKAKGIFRNQKIKPLVGDNVEIDVLDESDKKGNIIKIQKRKNELVRPASANVDQAMVIFAASRPEPNFNLLDRFLLVMLKQEVPAIVCFNKKDTVPDKELEHLQEAYMECGCQVIFTSIYTGEGMETVKKLIRGRTTILAGPSGVGKSSMLNKIVPEANMETGNISQKIKRGKHTTRHSEIFHVDGDTYLMDTPGFSSLYINDLEAEELKNFFPEFGPYEDKCRFQGCIHINEPDCAVKEALEEQKISRRRYENYIQMYRELKEKRRY